MIILEALEEGLFRCEKNDIGKFRIYNSRSRETRYHLKPGERTSYRNFRPLRHTDLWPEDASKYFLPRMLHYGQYNRTTTVQRSNHEVFMKKFSGVGGVHEVYGGHDYRAVVIRLGVEHVGIIETLKALENYPVIDESHLSALERRLQKDALKKLLPDFWNGVSAEWGDEVGYDILDSWEPDSQKELFQQMMERTGTYWIHEDPFTPYINTDKLAEAVTAEDLFDILFQETQIHE